MKNFEKYFNRFVDQTGKTVVYVTDEYSLIRDLTEVLIPHDPHAHLMSMPREHNRYVYNGESSFIQICQDWDEDPNIPDLAALAGKVVDKQWNHNYEIAVDDIIEWARSVGYVKETDTVIFKCTW
jgi:hypothetical protein